MDASSTYGKWQYIWSHSTLRDVPRPRYVQEVLPFVWRSIAAGWSQMYRKCSLSLLVAHISFLWPKYESFIFLVYSEINILSIMRHKYLLFCFRLHILWIYSHRQCISGQGQLLFS